MVDHPGWKEANSGQAVFIGQAPSENLADNEDLFLKNFDQLEKLRKEFAVLEAKFEKDKAENEKKSTEL